MGYLPAQGHGFKISQTRARLKISLALDWVASHSNEAEIKTPPQRLGSIKTFCTQGNPRRVWAGLASCRAAAGGSPRPESMSRVLRSSGFNWINKLWHIHTAQLTAAFKKNVTDLHVLTRTDTSDVRLSEQGNVRTQTQRHIHKYIIRFGNMCQTAGEAITRYFYFPHYMH